MCRLTVRWVCFFPFPVWGWWQVNDNSRSKEVWRGSHLRDPITYLFPIVNISQNKFIRSWHHPSSTRVFLVINHWCRLLKGRVGCTVIGILRISEYDFDCQFFLSFCTSAVSCLYKSHFVPSVLVQKLKKKVDNRNRIPKSEGSMFSTNFYTHVITYAFL